LIETKKLTKSFDGFLAVDQIDLHVPEGEILVMLGPNGAGKTTTVRMLTSILRPSAGTATIAGYDVIKDAAKVRSIVGVLTEHHGLYARMNAQEYLEFYGELYGLTVEESRARFLPLLEQFALDPYVKKRLGEYSKGMRQKLALIRALINNPPVLLLDEPTSAMDPESSIMVRNAIKSLKREDRTIILCTHNLNEAEELADQIAIIQKGKIIFNNYLNDVKKSLLGNPIFEARFLSEIGDWSPVDFPGVYVIEREKNSIKLEILEPEESNPKLIQVLSHVFNLISFEEKPRRLQDAYLEAVNLNGGKASHVNQP